MKNHEEQQAEDEFRELFLTPGWQRYLRNLRVWRDRVEKRTLYSVKSMEDVWRLRGQMEMIDWSLDFAENHLEAPANPLSVLDENPQEKH